MSKVTLKVIVSKEGRHYVAQCLNVDVSSFGSSEKAALNNLKEALELYFEDAQPAAVTPVSSAAVHQLTLQSA